ncbi:MAG: hypothetical protein NWE93_02405 [Candidatus Bathyarchaeota archaeon]|nr:hypothetical protein [Candidatus Bathyarchaeota archaeon]
MSKPSPPTFKGRSLGIAALTAAQASIGVIHVGAGALLLASEDFSKLPATAAYDVYTLVYGLLTLLFAVWFWQIKRWGWAGTVAVCLFVFAADSLRVLGLPTIPGIPYAPAFAEIAYSLLAVTYLFTANVRGKYLKKPPPMNLKFWNKKRKGQF